VTKRGQILFAALAASFILGLWHGLFAAQSKSSAASVETSSHDSSQPSVEKLDLDMYARIRDEGFNDSYIMQYASALTDGIGPRLTGSPNMLKANGWTRDQLTAMGCSNAKLEEWGVVGRGWQEENTWIRMVTPDVQPLIARALAWTPGTNGPVTAPVDRVSISRKEDMEKYRGKLQGKIALVDELKDLRSPTEPLFTRYDDKQLSDRTTYPVPDESVQYLAPETKNDDSVSRDDLVAFLRKEGAIAIIRRSGGDYGGQLSVAAGGSWLQDPSAGLPTVTMMAEHYGRIYRLLEANVPVTVELNVEVKITPDQQPEYNTVAEIAGTDPKLRDEVVMFGGHLDSWHSGTGATDNGAGAIVAIEAMRILNTLDIHPRRTIRIALWSGEEEGLYGSKAYVWNHFGTFPTSTAPDEMEKPEFARKPAGPITIKPEQRKVSVYFNIDNGTGRLRGIYLQGNASIAPIFEQWMVPLKDLGMDTVTMRNTGSTDHVSFDQVGIPGFQFIQDPADYSTRTHHTNLDLFERLQPADLRQAAVVEAIFVYNAAMRDEMLPRKPISNLVPKPARPPSTFMPGASVLSGKQ
jgi:peptidase M28-like protein